MTDMLYLHTAVAEDDLSGIFCYCDTDAARILMLVAALLALHPLHPALSVTGSTHGHSLNNNIIHCCCLDGVRLI